MGKLRLLAAAGAFALSVSASAAADLGPPPVHLPPPPPIAGDFGGWYLRGDVGVGIYTYDKFTDPGVERIAAVSGRPGSFLTGHLDDTAFAGVGVGYQVNNWFRFDLTGEYRTASKFGAVDRYDFDCSFAPFGRCDPFFGRPSVERNNVYSGSYSSLVGLANAYVDLGTFAGLSPFVGAGIGFANNRTRGVYDFDPSEFGGGGFAPAKTKTNVAFALHAGVGYEVSQNLKLEVAYRYLNLGDAETGKFYCFCGGAPGTAQTIKNIESHDIKIGMRWLLAAPAPGPVHYEKPLVRKF